MFISGLEGGPHLEHLRALEIPLSGANKQNMEEFFRALPLPRLEHLPSELCIRERMSFEGNLDQLGNLFSFFTCHKSQHWTSWGTVDPLWCRFLVENYWAWHGLLGTTPPSCACHVLSRVRCLQHVHTFASNGSWDHLRHVATTRHIDHAAAVPLQSGLWQNVWYCKRQVEVDNQVIREYHRGWISEKTMHEACNAKVLEKDLRDLQGFRFLKATWSSNLKWPRFKWCVRRTFEFVVRTRAYTYTVSNMHIEI